MHSVYVHFPYCAAKCPYCDFGVHVVASIPQRAFTDALLVELDRRLEREPWPTEPAGSVYLGGGTPSLWDPAELGRFLEGLAARVPVAAGAEVTLEANPGVAESRHLAEARAAGVNRVSFGTQSFQPRVLRALGRWHDATESARAVDRARAAGIDDVSVDLIYGAPGETVAEAAADGRLAAASAPDHVSAYALTLDSGVPLARQVRRGALAVPGDAAVVAQEDALRGALEAAGLARYEVASHARPGHRAVHNTGYWTGATYLALGPSAAGHRLDGDGAAHRYQNHKGVGRWRRALDDGDLPAAFTETLNPETRLAEALLTGLRLVDGVDLDALFRRTGVDPRVRHAGALEGLVAEGLLARDGDRVAPTARGLRFQDTVALRFL